MSESQKLSQSNRKNKEKNINWFCNYIKNKPKYRSRSNSHKIRKNKHTENLDILKNYSSIKKSTNVPVKAIQLKVNEEVINKIEEVKRLKKEIENYEKSILMLKNKKESKLVKLEDLRLLAIRISTENSFKYLLNNMNTKNSKISFKILSHLSTANTSFCLEDNEDKDSVYSYEFIENGCCEKDHFHFEMCSLFWGNYLSQGNSFNNINCCNTISLYN